MHSNEYKRVQHICSQGWMGETEWTLQFIQVWLFYPPPQLPHFLAKLIRSQYIYFNSSYSNRGGGGGFLKKEVDDIYLKFGHFKNIDNFFLPDKLTDRHTLWFIGKLHFQKVYPAPLPPLYRFLYCLMKLYIHIINFKENYIQCEFPT